MRPNQLTPTRRLALIVPALALALSVVGCSFRSPEAGDDTPPVDADNTPAKEWLRPWLHRKPITLLASRIEAPADGALADFPVLVSIADAQLAASALSSGDDIVFTAADGKTPLASEIESFTKANGQLIAWVKVPSLSATADTKLYIYYGHQSPPPRQPADVWTANYLAVWHLHQDPGPDTDDTIRDATRGNHHGTVADQFTSNDSVFAPIGRGLRFDGAQKYVNFDTMDFTNTFTISMWVNFAGDPGIAMLLANSDTGRDTDGFRFFANGTSSDHRILFESGNGAGGSGRVAETNANAIADNTPAHVAITVDGATSTALIYVNGIYLSIVTTTATNFRTSSDFELGRTENGFLHFPGTLDEVQISNTIRSPEWLLTSFRNQSRPDTFHTLDPEENL